MTHRKNAGKSRTERKKAVLARKPRFVSARSMGVCFWPGFLAGHTFIELLLAVGIAVIMAGVLFATLGSFGQRRKLEFAASKSMTDIRKTQQFARTQRDDHKYYGLQFFNGLGENGDCDGYKIVRYNPPGGMDPLLMVAGNITLSDYTVIKSSDENDSPEFLEDTFFDHTVAIDTTDSEFQVGDVIVFNPEGSATYDGANLLNVSNDKIVFTLINDNSEKKALTIVPLTGYVSIE